MSYNISENPDELLKAMARHERMIARLYQAYAERFTDYAAFWSDLAQAELRHAACLSKLRTMLQDDPDIVIVDRFSIDAIEFSINYIAQLIDRAQEEDFELINAFSLSMKLEEALLEKNFFEVLTGDSVQVQETLALLANETKQHFQLLDETGGTFKKPDRSS